MGDTAEDDRRDGRDGADEEQGQGQRSGTTEHAVTLRQADLLRFSPTSRSGQDSLGRVEQHDRDLPVGLVLVAAVVGEVLDDSVIEGNSNISLMNPYTEALKNGSVHYDHIATKLQRSDGDKFYFVNYQRLVMACRLPIGSEMVASLVVRTNNIIIDGVDKNIIPKMDPQFEMDIVVE